MTPTAKPTSDEEMHLPETQLQDIYKDLLSFPDADATAIKDTASTEEECLDIVRILEERLITFESTIFATEVSETTLSSRLLARMQQNPLLPEILPVHAHVPQYLPLRDDGSSLRMLINRLQSILDRMQSTWPYTKTYEGSSVPTLPPALLSNAEWDALTQVCLDADDAAASEQVLVLMKRSDVIPSDEQYDTILTWYANNGRVDEADLFFSRMAIDLSRDRQRDLLVKARLVANRLDDACALLHSFEKHKTPAPIQSYTRVIKTLFSQRGPGSEEHKAQAWDMFSHMRYVAHATADEFLYSTMMRACAEAADPEPERALDLFTEMTADNNIAPTTHAYNAVILTCARTKKFALEAFRLAREMLNSHRDAYGNTPTHLKPDNATFRALLEAAKRLGDLSRARLVLTQMTTEAQSTQDKNNIYVDERAMTHVFHAYASYRPPFRRAAVSFERSEGTAKAQDVGEDSGSQRPTKRDIEVVQDRHISGLPQSHQEVINEASAIWRRILEDRHMQSGAASRRPVFDRVSLTPALLNAYMAVHYSHSPPSAAYKVYVDLFEPLSVRRDVYSYVLALEAYAQGNRTSDAELAIALSAARAIWEGWRQQDVGIGQMSVMSTSFTVDARLVERAWIAMMRLLALNGHLNEAMGLLHQFVERYPPGFVKQVPPPDPTRSTRTSLYAERPIVRLTERSSVPEDRITPFLTFRDLNLLHQRSIDEKHTEHIAYIAWASNAYEGALRRRRDTTLRATDAK
ncbi:hypothetical protein K439DRAFT_1418570 [Ramaria rubella]|nr:hypothetical protein K439DRAFT_1418570 [Ramaria rubella]